MNRTYTRKYRDMCGPVRQPMRIHAYTGVCACAVRWHAQCARMRSAPRQNTPPRRSLYRRRAQRVSKLLAARSPSTCNCTSPDNAKNTWWRKRVAVTCGKAKHAANALATKRSQPNAQLHYARAETSTVNQDRNPAYHNPAAQRPTHATQRHATLPKLA